jgi:hypothetical protein
MNLAASTPKKRDEKTVMDTIGKLYQAEQKKENQITKLRHEKELRECQELKEKPDINHNYKLTRSRTPVHLRTNEELNDKFDEILRMKRGLEEKKQREVESECTFNPRTSNMEPLSNPMQTVEKLLKWKQEKHLETIKKVTLEANKEDETFHPKINPKSRKIAGARRRSEEALHDRLVHLKEKRDRAIEDIVLEEQKKLFNPTINKNSMKILERKRKILEGDGTELVRQKFLVEETDNAKYLRSEQIKSPAKDLLRLTIQETRKLRKERREKEREPQALKKNEEYANIKSRYKASANKHNRASRSASRTRSRSIKPKGSQVPVGYQSERNLPSVNGSQALRKAQGSLRPTLVTEEIKRPTSRSRSKSARSISRSKSAGSRRRPSESSKRSRHKMNKLAPRDDTDEDEEVEIMIKDDSPSRSASKKKATESLMESKKNLVPKLKSELDVRVSKLLQKNVKEKVPGQTSRPEPSNRAQRPDSEVEVEVGTQSPQELSPDRISQGTGSAPRKSSLKKQSRFEPAKSEPIFVQPNRHGKKSHRQAEPDYAMSEKIAPPKLSKIFFQSQAEEGSAGSPSEALRASKRVEPPKQKPSPPEIRWAGKREKLEPVFQEDLVTETEHPADPFEMLDNVSPLQKSDHGGWSVEETNNRKRPRKPADELEESRNSHIKMEGHQDHEQSPETPKYAGDTGRQLEQERISRQLKKLQIKEVFTNMYFD